MYSLTLIITVLVFTFSLYALSLITILLIVIFFLRQLGLANREASSNKTTRGGWGNSPTAGGWGDANNVDGWGQETNVSSNDGWGPAPVPDEPTDVLHNPWFRQTVNSLAQIINENLGIQDFTLPFPFDNLPPTH